MTDRRDGFPPTPASSSTPLHDGASEVPTRFLHVYGQHAWHGDAVIRGTHEALEALRSAIDEALVNGEGSADVLATDGERYAVRAILSNTVAGVGQPEYGLERTYQALAHERHLWGERNVLARGWDMPAVDDENSETPSYGRSSEGTRDGGHQTPTQNEGE